MAVHRRGAAAGHRRTGRRASGPAVGGPARARRDVFDRHRACRTAGFEPLRRRQRCRPGAARDGPSQCRRCCVVPGRRAGTRHPRHRRPRRPGPPQRRAATVRPARLHARARCGLLEAYRGRDLVVKCAPGIDFDELSRMGFIGEIEVTSLTGSVREACLWSAGLAGEGVTRRATMLDPARRSPTPNPTTARRCGGAMDRRPRRSGGARGPGAALRGSARAVAARPGHRVPLRRRAARRCARVSRCSRSSSYPRTAAASGAFRPATSVRSRSWSAGVDVDPDVLRSRMRLRGSQQVSVVIARIGVRARKPGNGIHLSSVTLNRHVPWHDAPVPKAGAGSRGRPTMRILTVAALVAAGVLAGSIGVPAASAAVGLR